MSFDWLNLVYACKRCNDAKGGQWPEKDDEANQLLAKFHPRYKPALEYVSPNAIQGRRSARVFFDFDLETGEILPAGKLKNEEWSVARRTIRDIDLNDIDLGENDTNHLWNRRKRQLKMLIRKLETLDEMARVRLATHFASPDRPYSSFIAAYFRRKFPQFAQLFPD